MLEKLINPLIQCGPTTGPQASQEKSLNLKFVERQVELHLSRLIACAG